MSFEDDPMENVKMFKCECGGDIELVEYNDGTEYYECDRCEFKRKPEHES